MNVLITSAGTELAQALAASLSGEHEVRLTDLVDVETDGAFVRCDLGHGEATDQLVAGMDFVVHLAQIPSSELDASDQPENRAIDFQTRCTYNLLLAAREAKVKRVVYASTLRLFEAGEEDWAVTEVWAPRPTPDVDILSPYLGEFVCREFGREGRPKVTCLRLGTLVKAGSDGGDATALELNDAVQAMVGALNPEGAAWVVYHVQSGGPGARFNIERAKNDLGFDPQFTVEG
ncbi:MAG: NAD(P)-dependent oxidoreductase [bacterium]|nr:NAD(P)-dependent oxidoreductase [bacterium]